MKTKSAAKKTKADGPGYPSAQWLYDEIMQWIEPDLCSGNITRLDALYPGESKEDRAARYERYTVAFIAFEDALLNFSERIEDDITMWRMDMEAYVRAVNANEESAKMREFERALGDVSSNGTAA